jgi:hypothetical protein
MIEIPTGKALIATDENGEGCDGCFLNGGNCASHDLACHVCNRADQKSVIFKIVNYPPNEAKNEYKTMNATLRGILDMFESAGFVVTHYQRYDSPDDLGVFKVALKSRAIEDALKDGRKETASAAGICALLEQNGFCVLRFDSGVSVIGEYAGTRYIEFEKSHANA